MKWAVGLVVTLALVGCKKKAADAPAGAAATAETDALWALAPDGTKLGIVASPRALQLVEHAWLDIHALVESAPEMMHARDQLDEAITELTGTTTLRFADLGIATDHGGAVFVIGEHENVVIVPLADRAKLLGRIRGKQGPDHDTLDNGVCKIVRGVYACANTDALLARLGKGDAKAMLAPLGERGDLEIVGDLAPLGSTARIAVAVQLSRGTVVVRGAVTNAPPQMIAMLGKKAKPRAGAGDAGFAIVHLEPWLANAPDTPIAAGVTVADLARSVNGPLTLTATAGTLGLDVRVPLSDPAPAKAMLAHCESLAPIARLPIAQDGDACTVPIPSLGLQLTAWLDGNTLRLGKRGATEGKPLAWSGIGAQLANEEWAAAFWGHGAMFGPDLPTAPPGELASEAAFALRAMSLVSELGAGVRLEGTTVKFYVGLRTAWANPDDVLAKVLAIGPADIAQGKASALAAPIVAAAPRSPFAEDVAAGYSGLIVPAALVGMMAAVAVPAFMDYLKHDAMSH